MDHALAAAILSQWTSTPLQAKEGAGGGESKSGAGGGQVVSSEQAENKQEKDKTERGQKRKQGVVDERSKH